jgi:N-acetylglucosaminyl-diphospho-decaprenol L-rhamnosyltransferase
MNLCVIILNYFGHKDTIECVKGLLNQDIDKIVIVDNSADAEEEKGLQAFSSAHPVVEVFPTGKNLGFAGGVNFALKRVLPEGFDEFVVLNNDTLPVPDLMAKLLQGAKARSLDLASPLIYNYPEKTVLWSKGNYYNKWTGLIVDKPLTSLPGNSFYLTGCCLYVRRGVFESLGLFDESFFIYGEDVEFCHRANQKGFCLGVVEDALIYHKTGASSLNNSFIYEYHMNLSHFILARKLARNGFSQTLAVCLKTIFLSIRALIRALRYRNLVSIKAYVKAVCQQCQRKMMRACD